jgi:hypothetical protein
MTRDRATSLILRAAPAFAACVLVAAPASAAPPVPTPIGVGPRFRLPATSASVAAARPVGRLRCTGIARPQRAHVELFARGRVLILPAGIGLARARACTYPLRTTTPTGVVEFDPSKRLTIGDFFAVWGQRLTPGRIAGFTGVVRAYVGGKRWRAAVGSIPLRRHAEIVLEVGPYVPPHATYLFGPGR